MAVVGTTVVVVAVEVAVVVVGTFVAFSWGHCTLASCVDLCKNNRQLAFL